MIETVTRGRRALLLRAAAVCCCFVVAPALADAPRPYGFRYAVHDRRTGDAKSQNEEGDGLGGVRGSYSLVEPDGSTRVVEYTADDERGFVARVTWTAPVHEASPSDEPGARKRRPLDEMHRPLDEQHRPLDEMHGRDVGTPRPGAPPSAYEFNVIAASDAQQPSVSPLSVHSYDV